MVARGRNRASSRRRRGEESLRNDRLKLPRSRVHHYEKNARSSPRAERSAISVEIKGFSRLLSVLRVSRLFSGDARSSGEKRSACLVSLAFSRKRSPAKTEGNFLKKARLFIARRRDAAACLCVSRSVPCILIFASAFNSSGPQSWCLVGQIGDAARRETVWTSLKREKRVGFVRDPLARLRKCLFSLNTKLRRVLARMIEIQCTMD